MADSEKGEEKETDAAAAAAEECILGQESALASKSAATHSIQDIQCTASSADSIEESQGLSVLGDRQASEKITVQKASSGSPAQALTDSLVSSHLPPLSEQSASPSASVDYHLNICSLPECVLLRAFQYLDIRTVVLVVRKTNRLWHNLSYDRCLWKTLQLDSGGFGEKMGDDSFLKMLAPIADLVEEITFGFTMLLTDESFMHRDIYCSKLTSLDFSLTNVTTNAICYLTDKYPNLLKLNLNHCSYINIYKCLDFVVRFQHLKFLSFEDFACPADDDKLNDKILNTFENCRNVESCDLYAAELSDATLAGIFKCSPKLKEIDVTGAEKISMEGFRALNKNIHSLSFLSIAYTMIGDDGLKVIAENSPKLKSLNIMSCICITDVGLGYVAAHCKELEGLLINKTDPEEKGCSITSSGMESVALGCPQLKTLYVSYCLLIDDKCIIAVAENCRNLSKLGLAGCLSITDSSLFALGRHSKHLRDLEISECAQVTSRGVGFLIAKCKWLRCLSLETCHRVEDICITKYQRFGVSDTRQGEAESDIVPEASGMDTSDFSSPGEMATLMKSMVGECGQREETASESEESVTRRSQSLELSGSATHPVDPTGPTEALEATGKEERTSVALKKNSLEDMDRILLSLKHRSHLQVLHLSFCSKVTDEAILEIAQHCPDLQELSLRGCHLVTDVSISTLVRSCEFLRILDISGGSSFFSMKMSNVSLSAIAHDCKHIERLMISKNKLINLSGLEVLFNKCTSLQSLELTVGEPMYASFTGVMSLVHNVKDRIVKIANKVQVVANKQTGNLHIEFYPCPESCRAASAVYFSYSTEENASSPDDS